MSDSLSRPSPESARVRPYTTAPWWSSDRTADPHPMSSTAVIFPSAGAASEQARARAHGPMSTASTTSPADSNASSSGLAWAWESPTAIRYVALADRCGDGRSQHPISKPSAADRLPAPVPPARSVRSVPGWCAAAVPACSGAPRPPARQRRPGGPRTRRGPGVRRSPRPRGPWARAGRRGRRCGVRRRPPRRAGRRRAARSCTALTRLAPTSSPIGVRRDRPGVGKSDVRLNRHPLAGSCWSGRTAAGTC